MSIAVNPSVRLSIQERLPWLIVFAGLTVMYGPTFFDLLRGIWSSNEQGHGPIVFGISLWLLYRGWPKISDPAAQSWPRPGVAWPLILFAAFAYALGRSQDILIFEVGSLIPMLAGVVLLLRGARQLKAIWFALFFMLFMVPLPGTVVDALTQPMKLAVSHVAEQTLFVMGYPVARTGVMLQIGPYQLLVADACAGLHTLFTLESLGLLYLNLVRHRSVFRNTVLALFIVPISFCANVIRVIVLTLVTYHFGDEAGQGFLHGFAGMVLFISALLLIFFMDVLLRAMLAGKGSPGKGDL